MLRPEAAIATRTALVGGGARGIGRAAAQALAEQGHDLVITGRTEADLISAAKQLATDTGRQVEYLVDDLADPNADTIARAARALRPIDVLVLNAGGPPPGRVLALDDDAWLTAAQLLLLGPLRLVRAALPQMAERGFGRVIAVTSTAVRQPQPDLAASVALRAALTSALKLASGEHAARGVTINCVAPGAIDTERRRSILANRAAATGADPQEIEAGDIQAIPAGRVGQAHEVAAMIAFLASDAAGYVNGTAIAVDGGRTESI